MLDIARLSRQCHIAVVNVLPTNGLATVVAIECSHHNETIVFASVDSVEVNDVTGLEKIVMTCEKTVLKHH